MMEMKSINKRRQFPLKCASFHVNIGLWSENNLRRANVSMIIELGYFWLKSMKLFLKLFLVIAKNVVQFYWHFTF